ncbi:hypothetical protein RJ641_017869 [Dillenia turbinata]|uniref:RING-type E3 ubiquitin transferase BRCA1 n=1 Tax=Dillenia turbinata TaxID=194707 RepID=A0AAN8Z1B8_9MAGN
MADPSHLEKMGRELKCPICLSLLNSAVSLPCNHVFCNSCIQKSMKSASDCPVCKVPYRRREIHPALHMDNLVNIYKNMEIASGINIFVTQNSPPTKLSDEGTEAKDNSGYHRLGTDGQGSRRSLKNKKEDSALDPVKPSFPTKKRVQVPQPLSETPELSRKIRDKTHERAKYEINNVSTVQCEKLTAQTLGKKEEVVFKPFFWLRDDDTDKEKSSQEADGDEVMETPVLDAPNFSDIKDSDDEGPSINTKDEMQNKSIDADIFDSEFFEWTQRPCSPELCSSPVKVQVANIREAVEFRGHEYQVASVGIAMEEQVKLDGTSSAKSSYETCIAELEQQHAASPRTVNDNREEGTKRLNKRGKKMSGRVQKKAKKCRNLHANHSGSSKEVPSLMYQKESHDSGNSLELGKACILSKSDGEMFDENPTDQLKESKLLVEGDSSHPDKSPMENLSTQPGKGSTKTLKSSRYGRGSRTCPVRSNKQKLDSPTSCMLGGASEIQGLSNKDLMPCSSFLLVGQHGSSDTMKRRNKQARGSPSLPDFKSDKESRFAKKLKGQRDNTVEKCLFKSIEDDEAAADRLETPVTPKLLNGQVLDDIKLAQTERAFSNMDGEILRKCETIPKKVECAFCHSTEDSEATGEMVHYFNGKPVATDFDRSSIIHSHKNCTEWAPNVFFENDTTINLEAELARSRRIKCSLCGNKGAALGCYEKSCRKSFHIPCAKSVPECRWDTENFVILCPLHPNSPLPCESPGSQKKKSSSNGQSPVPRSQVKVSHKINPHWKGNSGSSDKMNLCCSGLLPTEKETVAEFGRISGVTVLKNWSSDVTHVIASVDANGACRRTLKVLMGILEGKWILSIDWIKACMKAMEPVDEEQYEIKLDIHGNRDGPRLGRLRILNKGPKLFDSLKFYFSGDFLPSYKKCLQDLIIAAGGTILHRKPISEDKEDHQSGSSKLGALIIYSLELADQSEVNKKNMIVKRRRSVAEALAKETGSQIASNLWILNSIAACKLQTL